MMSYWFIVIITMAVGFGTQALVKHRLKKYVQVQSSLDVAGGVLSNEMLKANNVEPIQVSPGMDGADFFDPRSNSISLSPEYYSGSSVCAQAVACHEAGHACQYAQGSIAMKIRSALFPVVNLATKAWSIILMLGIIINMMGLIELGIILYAFIVLFQLATLPVEFGASARALKYLSTTDMSEEELKGAKKVLTACALTYVAAALASVLELLYWISILNSRRN